jgi:hypothetical protein
MKLKHISRVISISRPVLLQSGGTWRVSVTLFCASMRKPSQLSSERIRTPPRPPRPPRKRPVPVEVGHRCGKNCGLFWWIVVDSVFFCGLLIWKWSVIDKVYLQGIYIILYLESMSHCKKWRMWMFKDSCHIHRGLSHGISSDINVQFMGLHSNNFYLKNHGVEML